MVDYATTTGYVASTDSAGETPFSTRNDPTTRTTAESLQFSPFAREYPDNV
ncbi:hypothetical protein [Natronosalvus vescus]|uniref:hypothetical protein n=1 Tax=Natronosalvus vescus TaxID=2953881 RepID=UPI002091C594|nr:hypothetical protein [Natronosalvus vescus]